MIRKPEPGEHRIRRGRHLWLSLLLLITTVLFFNFLIQSLIEHDTYSYHPDYEQVDLDRIFEKESLSDEDYHTVFLQTGITKTGVQDFLEEGREEALAKLRALQQDFFHKPTRVCKSLLPLKITCEDRLRNHRDQPVAGTELAHLKPGDILITLSTHTLGWRHGHAGLVVDTDPVKTLEAAVLGENTEVLDADHWRCYTDFIVLRVKDTTEELRKQVVSDARKLLEDIPYSLFSGLFGPKAPDVPKTAQCAYLPWYAWKHVGIDLDCDKGKIVTVMDLLKSPYLEVIQVYGINPVYFRSH